ncbi:hypothetical protein BOX15_Mlig016674g2 [Macrostomum lignano]|uniref:Uncharacterized protein n=2 Tax=Macrostomum lignano TaxID=282301 RepID=A0A1I8JML6_9PLAT|nr:hypothetical protein BOX15_Mlig016674g2 [Macrostomum lignano]
MLEFSEVCILLLALTAAPSKCSAESSDFGWICEATKEFFVASQLDDLQLNSSDSSARVCLHRTDYPDSVLLYESTDKTEAQNESRILVFELPDHLKSGCSSDFFWQIERQPIDSTMGLCDNSIPNKCFIKVGWHSNCPAPMYSGSQQLSCYNPPSGFIELCQRRSELGSNRNWMSSNSSAVAADEDSTGLQVFSAVVAFQLWLPLLVALVCGLRYWRARTVQRRQRSGPAVPIVNPPPVEPWEAERALQMDPDTCERVAVE